MMKFATQRHIAPALVLGCMYLLLPLPIAAAEIVSVAEIRELQEILAQQDLQLSAQQELIDSQQEEIGKQRTLLQSVQAQLNRLAANQPIGPSQENAAQPQQSIGLDEIVAAQTTRPVKVFTLKVSGCSLASTSQRLTKIRQELLEPAIVNQRRLAW